MQIALRARLKADAAVAAIIGTRVDWGLRPQGKNPRAIRLSQISAPRGYTMAGAQKTQIYRVQMDCYGSTHKEAHELGEAVVACIEPATGAFLASFAIDDRDNVEVTDTGAVHCRKIDFQITHISA